MSDVERIIRHMKIQPERKITRTHMGHPSFFVFLFALFFSSFLFSPAGKKNLRFNCYYLSNLVARASFLMLFWQFYDS